MSNEPASLPPPTPEKWWSGQWSVGLSLVSSLIVGVVANFLTGYVKEWLSAYFDRVRLGQVRELISDLSIIDKSHESMTYYISFIMTLLFTAGLLNVFTCIH